MNVLQEVETAHSPGTIYFTETHWSYLSFAVTIFYFSTSLYDLFIIQIRVKCLTTIAARKTSGQDVQLLNDKPIVSI